MNISIVIPLLNEEESINELYHWIADVMQSNGFLYELIYIDDGSTDDSWKLIQKLATAHPEIKAIQFLKNFGKSQALHAGFALAKGEVVITMDADLQDNPEEIPDLYNMIIEDDYQLVSGWKKKRYDSLISKNLPSKLFNLAARKTSGVKLHDFNCGLKAYNKDVIKTIEVTGEMHRYIPVLAKNAGFSRIGEKVVLPTQGFTKLPYNGEEYYVGPENQILAKINKSTSIGELLDETKENLTKEEIKDLTHE